MNNRIIINLIIGGLETTINSISFSVYSLINNPSQIQKLQSEPDLIKIAIEELLRFTSPVQCLSLYARDSFNIKDNLILKGQKVNLIIGAANHDPEKFTKPDELDITRKPNPHLTFSSGHHYCIGAGLARLEMEIAISNLFSRLSDMKVISYEYNEQYNMSGFKHLKIHFKYS